jgi:hypothetical protein
MATSSTIAPSAFTITQAGLNAAMLAQGQGLSISITRFTLGTGYNYTPGLNDTIIHGTEVYSDAPSSWNMLSEITRDIVCIVPATAGPFTFGEIALYLSDGTLFALAAFGALQTKASAASGVANALTFHCVLNIGMSPSVIQVITGTPGVIEVVGSTNNVTGQRFLPGQPDALIVMEAVNGNNSLFLTASNGMQWNVANYLQVDSGILASVENDGVTLNGPAFNLMDAAFLPGDFLMQDMLGNVRVIASGSPGVANLTYPITGLAAGATVMLLARETTLSDYVFLETVIEQKDKAQTDALNSAISLLTQTLADEMNLLNQSLTDEEALINQQLAQAKFDMNRALADMNLQVTNQIAAAQAAVTAVQQALKTLGTVDWTVTQEGANLVFRYQGRACLTIDPYGVLVVPRTGDYTISTQLSGYWYQNTPGTYYITVPVEMRNVVLLASGGGGGGGAGNCCDTSCSGWGGGGGGGGAVASGGFKVVPGDTLTIVVGGGGGGCPSGSNGGAGGAGGATRITNGYGTVDVYLGGGGGGAQGNTAGGAGGGIVSSLGLLLPILTAGAAGGGGNDYGCGPGHAGSNTRYALGGPGGASGYYSGGGGGGGASYGAGGQGGVGSPYQPHDGYPGTLGGGGGGAGDERRDDPNGYGGAGFVQLQW